MNIFHEFHCTNNDKANINARNAHRQTHTHNGIKHIFEDFVLGITVNRSQHTNDEGNIFFLASPNGWRCKFKQIYWHSLFNVRSASQFNVKQINVQIILSNSVIFLTFVFNLKLRFRKDAAHFWSMVWFYNFTLFSFCSGMSLFSDRFYRVILNAWWAVKVCAPNSCLNFLRVAERSVWNRLYSFEIIVSIQQTLPLNWFSCCLKYCPK